MIARHAARLLAALAGTTAIILLAAMNGASADTSSPMAGATSAPVLVVINDFAFKPQSLTIKPGTTVQWRNDDGISHTATDSGGAFDSHNLDKGMTYSFTFTKAGTYSYVCSYHPNMTGTIVVSDSASQ